MWAEFRLDPVGRVASGHCLGAEGVFVLCALGTPPSLTVALLGRKGPHARPRPARSAVLLGQPGGGCFHRCSLASDRSTPSLLRCPFWAMGEWRARGPPTPMAWSSGQVSVLAPRDHGLGWHLSTSSDSDGSWIFFLKAFYVCIYLYLFGCARSYLGHTGSSIFMWRVRSFSCGM